MAITFKSFVGDAPAIECVEVAGTMPSNERTVTAGTYSKGAYSCTFSSAASTIFNIQHTLQDGTAAGWSRTATGSVAHLVQQFAFRMSAVPADPIMIGFFDAIFGVGVGTGLTDAALPEYFVIHTDGKVKIYAADFTTVLQTSTNALAIDTWYYFLAISDMDTAADTYRVRLVPMVGGAFDLSAGIIDYTATGATGPDGAGTWYFDVRNPKTAVNPATTFYFDDMVMYSIASDSDIRTRSWLAGQRVPYDALGTDQDFTNGSGGNPAVANIDDLDTGNMSDAEYDEATVLGTTKEQTYTSGDLSPAIGNKEIAAVVNCIRIDGNGSAMQHRVYVGGSVTNITGTSTATPFHNTCQKMLVTPSGATPAGAAWTEALINGSEMGLKRANTTGTGKVSVVALVVWYWTPVSLVVPSRSFSRTLNQRR